MECKRKKDDKDGVQERREESLIYNKKKMGLELLVGPGAFN
jgi:hypothetical protein